MNHLYNFIFTTTTWTFEFFDSNNIRQTVIFYTKEEAEAFNKDNFNLNFSGCCE